MKTKLGKATMMGALTVVAGLITAGCATNDPEYAEYEQSMTVTESAGAEASTMSTQDEMVIPLHKEEIKVGKRTVDSGNVTLRKVVTTETVSEPVELRKEHLVIERRGAGVANGTQSSDASAASDLNSNFGAPFEERTVTIQLRSEEPVVETTTVTSGEVVAKKNIEWDKQTIQRDIRREDISVDRQGSATIEEAAGAESNAGPGKGNDDVGEDLELEE